MKQTRFSIAKKDIVSFFNDYLLNIFTYDYISQILNDNKKSWRLPVNLSARKFIELLLKKTKLKAHKFSFPSRQFVRYTWGDVSVFQLALSLKERAYFTHYTALYLHNLTDQIPKTIYINVEQSKKTFNKTTLSQEKINFAFSKSQRISKNIAPFSDYKICLLNSKFTDMLGVIEIVLPGEGKLFVTDIERTLIDITVRPVYAGGVYEVLNAYKRAKDKVSVNKLSALLKKLNYTYPYHQAIGFYLDKSGVYSETQLKLLRKYDFKYDFYLTYQMKQVEYSKKWKLYYPKGF